MKDETGSPIFVVKVDEYGGHEFFPYNLATIHEFIKAKQEINKEKSQVKKSEAV